MTSVYKIMKVRFNPKESNLKDIFSHQIATNLWCKYRNNHIISSNGLEHLNRKCREIIKNNTTFNEKTARKFLTTLQYDLADIEYSRISDDGKWVDEAIGYLTGGNNYKMKFIPKENDNE